MIFPLIDANLEGMTPAALTVAGSWAIVAFLFIGRKMVPYAACEDLKKLYENLMADKKKEYEQALAQKQAEYDRLQKIYWELVNMHRGVTQVADRSLQIVTDAK